MSHHEYDEWYGKGEIGIHCLKWSIQADFCVRRDEKLALHPSCFQHQYCVCLDPHRQ